MRKVPLVFVVEDDKLFQEILIHHLHHTFGFKIEAYSSGEECLVNLHKNPEIVILDYNLLNINGLEVLKKLKEFNPNNFVLFVTSEALEIARESIKTGANDYILKDDNTLDNISEKIQYLQNLKEISSIKSRRNSILGFSASINLK